MKTFEHELRIAGYKPDFYKFDSMGIGEVYRFGPKRNHWMIKNADGSVMCADWSGQLSKMFHGKPKKEYEKETPDYSKYRSHLHNSMMKGETDNPYLLRKGILEARKHLSGILEAKDHLLCPMLDINGSTITYQKIGNDGSKRNLKGHSTKGGFFPIGLKEEVLSSSVIEKIIICEGLSTGCSLYLATGIPVVVAFSSQNINEVTGKFRNLFPSAHILIAGDDDLYLEKQNKPNAGKKCATDAASNHQCYLVFPDFSNDSEEGGDFNDLHLKEGLPLVRDQIEEAFNSIPHQSRFPIILLEDCFDEDRQCYKKFRISLNGNVFEKYIHASEVRDRKKIVPILDGFGFSFEKEQLNELLPTIGREALIKSSIMNNECGWRMSGEFYLPGLDKPCVNNDYKTFKRCGNLEDFKSEIYPIAHANPLITFILSYAFLPPFLKRMNLPNFGVHLYGESSIGKTTLLNLAASVWGAPIEQWNGTLVGFEDLGYRYKDTLLCLDEINQIKSENLAQIIYSLGNGGGRIRFKSRDIFRSRAHFKINFLSSGESSIQERLKENFTGGQGVRLIDISCHRHSGIFDVTSNPKKDISKLNKIITSNNNFPMLGLINNFEESQKLFEELYIENPFEGQMGRIKDLFILIEKAGLVAVKLGLLPKLDISESVERIFSSLPLEQNNSYELEIAKTRLFELVENGQAFFYGGGQFERLPYNVKGYKKESEKPGQWNYYINSGTLKNEICKDINFKSVKEKLVKNNILLPSKTIRIGQQTTHVYPINDLWFKQHQEKEYE